jgi:hypothetical protein
MAGTKTEATEADKAGGDKSDERAHDNIEFFEGADVDIVDDSEDEDDEENEEEVEEVIEMPEVPKLGPRS